MDYSKLADEFIEEGAWQGAPVIAVAMFAKWLKEREAAQQSVRRIGGNVCPLCGLDCGDALVHENCAAANR